MLLGPILDRVLRISVLDALYRRHRLRNLPPFEFSSQALRALNISACPSSARQVLDQVPTDGATLVVCNHPYGGIEALILADVLQTVRTDVKFLANTALRVFPEFQPLMIATNPLVVTQKNLRSIRQCEAHLSSGGLLVVFPAGRVSSYQKNTNRITDSDWNRIVGHLAQRSQACLLPLFFHGSNSRLFHSLGRLWDRSKLLMLPREFLKLRGRTIQFDMGRPLAARTWSHLNVAKLTRFARVMTYLQATDIAVNAEEKTQAKTAPQLEALAPLGNRQHIVRELDALPDEQQLLNFKQFSVFYATASQIPVLMLDIARERERVFRAYDEGSGQARDGDEFDKTYTQLFVWDHHEQSLVGAYRLGKTDVLLQQNGRSGLYLSKMFQFDDSFHQNTHQNNAQASLELGRSFVTPEHQNSFHALYLLWKGIGHFLVKHPHYRRLYGTVSLSRQYDDRAVAVMCDALITPTEHVRPRHPLPLTLNNEWRDYCADNGRPDFKTLSAFVRGLDAGGKDIPILLKHYHKLGATFHCVGIDRNFNDTPGLLLSIDMTMLKPKVMTTYFGAGSAAYLAH
ncbi:MAG: lysophospholipid acyltransferase family protein [Gammaproteobacteria bacterium]|nr:lysophospholipid acyltransferase family protein [Gammaproteobacteria bacterium]